MIADPNGKQTLTIIAIARTRPLRSAMAMMATPNPIASDATPGAAYQPANVADTLFRIEQTRCRNPIDQKSGVHGHAQVSAETTSIAETTGVSARVVSDPPNAY